MSKPVAIIQARIGSSRMPGKVLKPLLGRPMLWHILDRLSSIDKISKIVVATTDETNDKPIRDFCENYGVACFAGSEDDLLDRFYKTAIAHNGNPVIRITGDCPCLDPDIISRLIQLFETGKYDHVGVATGAGAIFNDKYRFPDGFDAECFSFDALKQAWTEAEKSSDREHVTPYLWRQPDRFRLGSLSADKDYSFLRLTVDTETDFELIEHIYQSLYREEKPFLLNDIIKYLRQNPEVASLNQSLIGQEGYRDLWKLRE